MEESCYACPTACLNGHERCDVHTWGVVAVGYHVVPTEGPVTIHGVPKKASKQICQLSSKPSLFLHAQLYDPGNVTVKLADL